MPSDPRLASLQPGDWVRVQRGGRLLLASVEYIQPQRWSASTLEAVTDVAGVVQFDEVYEVRRKQVEP